ncbi:M15 family metallopeptidase [Sulfurimonas sp.]|uniref:M15 family metallopeptidase n=1 Tax=Sulfurimonas sp. TaxID=2022749 RepID=UPI003D12257C
MAEEKVKIPNFSYPFKNIKDIEKDCYKNLENKPVGNYLFSAQGLWHGGMHFDKSFDKEIRAIADGELVAYRLNEKYLQDEGEAKVDEGLYSTGFFLLKHTLAYPKTNKLTFFSLYMHTAKKDEYNLDTHKVIGEDGKRNLRKGVSYAEADKLEELAQGTKITIDPNQTTEEKDKHRYKVLYVGDTKRTDGATIHQSNIQALDNVHKLKTITKETEAKEAVQFPTQKIEIKAGEVIGLKGVYAPAKQKTNEIVHIEVFAADVQTFAEAAQKEYEKDKSKDRPKPKTVKVLATKKLYKKIEKCKLSQNSNIRKGFSNSSEKYNNDKTDKDTTLEIDSSQSQKVGKYTRVVVTKIGEVDVSADNYTVINSVFKDQEIVFEELGKDSIEKTFQYKDVKKEKDSSDNEYLLYDKGEKQYLKYSDCKEQHPITFEWAKIIQMQSDDNVSLFQKLSNYLVPSLQSDDLKYNSSYSELFNMIDKDHNGMLEPQELSKAAANKEIKKTTANYIVQHSSEWDATVNMADVVLKIYKEHKDTIESYDQLEQHYKNQKTRITNLAFFEKCKDIDGFPTSDMVYHLNPIGLVSRFGSEKQETWDVHTNKKIKTLHPKIRNLATEFINKVETQKNIRLRVTQALRTIDEQNQLYAQGRTTSGNKVTWVKGGYSFHNYGLAIDVVKIEKNGTINWNDTTYFSDIAQIGKSLGFEWGGDWTSTPDKPHFQYTFGYTTAQLKVKYDNGDLEDGYVKI